MPRTCANANNLLRRAPCIATNSKLKRDESVVLQWLVCYKVITCQFIIYGYYSFVKFARAVCMACAI